MECLVWMHISMNIDIKWTRCVSHLLGILCWHVGIRTASGRQESPSAMWPFRVPWSWSTTSFHLQMSPPRTRRRGWDENHQTGPACNACNAFNWETCIKFIMNIYEYNKIHPRTCDNIDICIAINIGYSMWQMGRTDGKIYMKCI